MSSARAPFDPSRLRAAREAAGLSQHELALRSGVVGGDRVSKWERGQAVPRPAVLARVAEVLGINAKDLLAAEMGQAGLLELRLAAGLTRLQVAQAVHVGERTVARWEKGEFKVMPDVVAGRRLAVALGVEPDQVRLALEVSRG